MNRSIKFFAVSLLFASSMAYAQEGQDGTAGKVFNEFKRGSLIGLFAGAGYLTSARFVSNPAVTAGLTAGAAVVGTELKPRKEALAENRTLFLSSHVAGIATGAAAAVIGGTYAVSKISSFFNK
jgi:hypothetical protein